MICLVLCGLDSVVLGLSGPGPEESHEALTLAQELSHPFSLAFALVLPSGSISLRREGTGSPGAGRGSYCALVPSRVSVLVGAWGLSCGAGRWPEQGQGEEGIAQIRQGLAALQATGAELHGRIFLPCWPRRMGRAEQAEEGLSVLAEALAIVEKTGERLLRGGAVSAQGRADASVQTSLESRKVQASQKSKIETDPRPLTPDPQGEAEACFLQGDRDCAQAASQVAGAAGGDEPCPAVAAAGQESTKLTSCYPRSTAGSPKGLTPKICKRPRRCWTSWRRRRDEVLGDR